MAAPPQLLLHLWVEVITHKSFNTTLSHFDNQYFQPKRFEQCNLQVFPSKPKKSIAALFITGPKSISGRTKALTKMIITVELVLAMPSVQWMPPVGAILEPCLITAARECLQHEINYKYKYLPSNIMHNNNCIINDKYIWKINP